MAVKIVIANDQHVHRHSSAVRLQLRSDFEICAQVANGIETLRTVKLYQPDILLLDLHMPLMDGFEVLKTLHKEKSAVKTIVVSMLDHQENIAYCMSLGACGFLSTFNETDNEETAIDSVMANGFYFNSQTEISLIRKIIRQNQFTPHFNDGLVHFSDIEMKLLHTYCTKYHNEDVAKEICASISKVERLKSQMVEKLNVQNFINVLIYAHQKRLIDLDSVPIEYKSKVA